MSSNEKTRVQVGKARGLGNFDKTARKRRVPWRILNDNAKSRRYEQAVRGYNAGLHGGDPGSYSQYARKQIELDRRGLSATPVVQKRPRPRTTARAMFGSGARTEILALLAKHGPLTVREIARLRDVDASWTFRAVNKMLESAIIVKRDRAGGRKFVTLNRAHPAHGELVALLLVVAKDIGLPEFEQARYRHGLPLARSEPPDADAAPALGSPLRARILVMLALMVEADPTQLAKLTGENRLSVYYACHALHEREKILRCRKQGVRTIYGLATNYPGASHFIDYLKAVSRASEDNVAIANSIVGITSRWF